MRCWGANDKGQLGDGSRNPRRPSPGAPISGLRDVVQLSSAFEHTCAVTGAGSVWCWGHNRYGQLGFTGETSVPVEIQNLGDKAKEVSCRGIGDNLAGHSCARMDSGRVKCWGGNYFAQLGDGTHADSATPVDVLNLTDAIQIAAADSSTCALRATGKVVCWGANSKGMLATGSTAEFVTTPEEVVGLSGVHAIDAGSSHFCAVFGPERRLKCWGYDHEGELGDGPDHDFGGVATVPVDTTAHHVEEVRTGWRTTCVRLSNGEVMCWGLNSTMGFLGNGSIQNTNAMGSRTLLAAPAVRLDLRWEIGCAVLTTGQVECWGSYGRIVATDMTPGLSSSPQLVAW